jgi:membrane protease YdiL (CAAX protease family)
MAEVVGNPRRKIAIFLALTLALSAATWVPQISAGKIHPLWILGTMWAPGIASIATRLIVQGDLRGMGWKPRTLGLLGLAYALPLLYALPVYGLAWAGGLGTFDEGQWIVTTGIGPWAGLALILSAGLASSLISATGEEIGWRGLLVPELMKLTSFRNTALISGAVWAAWHMPLLLFADYRGHGTPLAYSLVCFAAMVLGLSVIMAWLTVRSGSLWPAVILHAAHNLFVQNVFDLATVEDDRTNYLTSEFGIGLAVTVAIAAAILLRVSPISEKGRAEARPSTVE